MDFDAANSDTSEDHSAPNRFGILSRTVFQSPIVNEIIRARIRDPGKVDLVFVGEHHIQVKEVLPNGRLHHIVSKSDFHSHIQSAAILKNDASWGIGGDMDCLEDRFASDVKIQDVDDSKGPFEIDRPKEILILAMKSSELLLLGLHAKEEPTFYELALPLPKPVGLVHGAGAYIAVDRYSRAIAVTATQDALAIYQIKTALEWQQNIDSIIDHSIVLTHGITVLKMEFLCPDQARQDTVYLLLIGSKNGRLVKLIYSWDHSKTLAKTRVEKSGPKPLSLHLKHGIPQLLIPLTVVPEGFMLICERYMAIYDKAYIDTRPPLMYEPLHEQDSDDDFVHVLRSPAQNPGSTSRDPLWRGWARAYRWYKTSESLYLGREDGTVVHCLIMTDKDGSVNTQMESAAQFPLTSDKAFNEATEITNIGANRGGDLDGLVACGSGSDGGIWQIGNSKLRDPLSASPMEPEQTEIIYNWAPFIDVTTTESYSTATAITDLENMAGETMPSTPQSVYATCGATPHGGISRLRYGHEIILNSDAEVGAGGANRIWAIPVHGGVGAAVLSLPDTTTIIYDPTDVREGPRADMLCDERTLVLECLTSSADQTTPTSHRFLQVTPSSIGLLHYRYEEEESMTRVSSCFMDFGSVATYELPYVVSSNRVGQSTAVMLRHIRCEDMSIECKQIGIPPKLDSEVTCISFCKPREVTEQLSSSSRVSDSFSFSPGNLWVVVGCTDGSLHVFEARPDDGLVPLTTVIDQTYMPDQMPASCESLATLYPASSSLNHEVIIVCGRRDGTLSVFWLRLQQGMNLDIVDVKHVRVGYSSVHIIADISAQLSAFVYCGLNLCRMKFNKKASTGIEITSVYFTNLADRSFELEDIISSLCIVPVEAGDAIGSKDLMCTSGQHLMFGNFDMQAKPLPLRLPVPGTPFRTLYSRQFQRLFVASTIVKVQEQPTPKRFLLSAIFVVEKKASKQDGDEKLERLEPSFVCAPGERITSLVEWFYQNDEDIHYSLIATTINTDHAGQQTGRIKLLKVKHDATTCQTRILLTRDCEESKAVYALCQLSNDSLIYCCGDEIKMRTYLIETGTFAKKHLLRTNSPGTFISARDNLVQVTMSNGPLSIYRYANEKLTPIAQDDQARNGLCHLRVAGFVLGTDMSKSLFGIAAAENNEQLDYPTPTIFESVLSQSITRLCLAHIRPLWKSKALAVILERDILGTASDGSLYSFSILHEDAWRLLRFVQNICSCESSIRRVRKNAAQRNMHMEPDTRVATSFQIDGDLLWALTDRADAHVTLEQSIIAASQQTSRAHGSVYETADNIKARLKVLIHEFLSANSRLGDDTGNTRIASSNDLIETTICILKEVLDSPF